MGNHRFWVGLVLFALGSYAVADTTNPFAKTKEIELSGQWLIKDKTATKTGSDSGTFYHLYYDKRQLRLRMGESADDTDAGVKKYDQLAIEDVKVDGQRLPLFQWCLLNQERHSRFLQQGLSVRKNICVNDGAKGSFTMLLNTATLDALKSGSKLTFVMSPYRTSITVSYDISDFKVAAEKLATHAVAKKPEPAKKCTITPPEGFALIKPAEYDCDDESSKSKANAKIAGAVKAEQDRRKKQADEAEARRKKQKELAEKKATEGKEKAAAAAAAAAAASATPTPDASLAVSAPEPDSVGGEVSSRMLEVCKKKWAEGEHRCYCEKFLEHAPPGIESDPTCK